MAVETEEVRPIDAMPPSYVLYVLLAELCREAQDVAPNAREVGPPEGRICRLPSLVCIIQIAGEISISSSGGRVELEGRRIRAWVAQSPRR